MHTKKLYDIANDNELDFYNRDDWSEALPLWINAALADEEFVAENWADFTAVLFDNKEKTEIFVRRMSGAFEDTARIKQAPTMNITVAYLDSYNVNVSQAYSLLFEAFIDMTIEYVSDRVDDWWVDCMGYHVDMMEGGREDAEDFRRDR